MAVIVAMAGLLCVAGASSPMEAPALAAVDDAEAGVSAPAPGVCVADFDSDKDTADREFTSPPAAWLALGPGTAAPGQVRSLTLQLAAPPPQRPPRLAA